MAPMTTWASNDDGTISDEEDAYYRCRAKDVGLVITGCTHVQSNGIGFTGEFASYDDTFIPSLRKLATAAKSGGAPAILQLFHAGVKTRPELVDDVIAASAVSGHAGPFADAIVPRALEENEIVGLIEAFAAAARRAIAAGFDGIELHGAHGFLLQNFFSPHSNVRTDKWGGSLENRMRFPLAVVSAVKAEIAKHANKPFALGYRITVEEAFEGGLQLADSLQLVTRLVDAEISYLHVSLSSALDQKPVKSRPNATIVSILNDHIAGRIPLIGAGQLKTPAQAENALNQGLSLIAVGKALVINPDWVADARTGRDGDIHLAISAANVAPARIPHKLWTVIDATPGWFNVVTSPA